MIIGINGYIGSGKDTVGALIQKLTRPVLAGDKGIKNDEGDIVPLMFGNSDWQIKKFAEKLKQVASLLTGIPREKFEDQEFKKTFLDSDWDYNYRLPRETLDQENVYWELRQMTVREFLQKLGTEAIRDGVHTNAWVNALFADYKPTMTYRMMMVDYTKTDEPFEQVGDSFPVYPNWIITDARFPNEAQAIKNRGGIVIRINRQLEEVSYQTLEQRHPSETSLDDWEFDHVIENNGTLQELEVKVKELLDMYLIP